MNRSIVDYLSVDDLVAEVYLMRGYNQHLSICLIEGQTDLKLLKKFFNSESCDFVICYGKEPAVKVFDKLKTNDVIGLLAILDRDFDIFYPEQRHEDILYWDGRDLENYLFSTPAFEAVLAEHSSVEKMTALQWSSDDVKACMLECAKQIGKLRFIAKRDSIPLKFSTISYSFICKNSLDCNVEELCEEVSRKSQCGISGPMLSALLDQFDEANCEVEHLCQGHDLTAIFGIMLKKRIGSIPANHSDANAISSKLRLGLATEVFESSNLYRSIRDWEQRSSPFQVLAA
jgi:hypothetical protein